MARERKPSSKIDRLLDELMEDGVDAEDLFGEDGLLAHEEAHGRADPGSLSSPITSATRSMPPMAGTAATVATARPPRRSKTTRAICR